MLTRIVDTLQEIKAGQSALAASSSAVSPSLARIPLTAFRDNPTNLSDPQASTNT
ncbi:MAG: hypothetical protein LBK47_09565 [Prevotellaceae bacterium]|nr:hypothetical protein [Prevotellaceae bacterium]